MQNITPPHETADYGFMKPYNNIWRDNVKQKIHSTWIRGISEFQNVQTSGIATYGTFTEMIWLSQCMLTKL